MHWPKLQFQFEELQVKELASVKLSVTTPYSVKKRDMWEISDDLPRDVSDERKSSETVLSVYKGTEKVYSALYERGDELGLPCWKGSSSVIASWSHTLICSVIFINCFILVKLWKVISSNPDITSPSCQCSAVCCLFCFFLMREKCKMLWIMLSDRLQSPLRCYNNLHSSGKALM